MQSQRLNAMSKSLRILLILFFSSLLVTTYGQIPRGEKLKVFLDCQNTRCDQDYFRSEINVIDFFRDRLLADVHALVTANRNPSGGRNYQMIFFGLNDLEGVRDTINFTTGVNTTDFEQRDDILNNLKLGLLPFIAKTSYAKDIYIDMKVPGLEEVNRPAELADKWDYWVFRLSGDGSYEEDANYLRLNLSGRAIISRITEKNKFFLFTRTSERSRRFKFASADEDDQIVVTNYSTSMYNQYVISISDHWSVGYEASYRHDTFENFKNRLTVSPAVEYSIFPYKDFNTKFFTVRYSAGLWASQYIDSTIYNKISENRWRQQVEMNADFNQPWGNVGVGARFSHFLDDITVNNLRLEADVEIRITGGLFVNFNINGSLIHDQINLPKGQATEEEVLTQLRQLQTNYDFGTRFGISYRFGSNINNIVNPRFDD